MTITRFSAIKSLVGGELIGINDCEDVKYMSGQTPPTEKQISDEIARLEKEASDNEYKGKRAIAYPKIGNQLDLLFHDMTSGKGDKSGEWYKAIAKVKSDNPKG